MPNLVIPGALISHTIAFLAGGGALLLLGYLVTRNKHLTGGGGSRP